MGGKSSGRGGTLSPIAAAGAGISGIKPALRNIDAFTQATAWRRTTR